MTDPDPLPESAALAQIAAIDWGDTNYWPRWQRCLAEAARHNASLARPEPKPESKPKRSKNKPILFTEGPR